MKTICAWCGGTINIGSGPITHGICSSCSGKFVSAHSSSLESIIDELPFPIIVLGESLLPVSINTAGKRTFELQDRELSNCTLGLVVECENSSLPGGCGHTDNCSGCVLRRTATSTYETGRPANVVPATVETEAGLATYYLSAVKVGDCVVLKLEQQRTLQSETEPH